MGQTASVPANTVQGERDVKRQRRHSSQASASKELDRGSKRVSSRHSRIDSRSPTRHRRKHSREFCSHHDEASTILPRQKSTRSSPPSTSHRSERSKDSAV